MRIVTPMIHVPDVARAVDWYRDIGFSVLEVHHEPCENGQATFAILAFGEGQVMFNAGGAASDAHRREVDLYVQTEGVDALYARLKATVETVEPPHDAFYGMREFIIRDLNRFWITFGEPVRA